MFRVHAIPALSTNYIWCLLDETKKQMICFDPGDAQPVLDWLDRMQYELIAICITHHHWDHTGGLNLLLAHFTDIPVYGPTHDTITQVTHRLVESDQVTLPLGTFQILEAPGHTHGHIVYFGEQCLFCGDVLFSAGCGRVFEGTMQVMYDSLMKLKQLPKETWVYPAHEYTESNCQFALSLLPDDAGIQAYLEKTRAALAQKQISLPSTIENELQVNLFFRCDDPKLKEALHQKGFKNLDDPYSVFKALRTYKDGF